MTKNQVYIRNIVVHREPHLDELFAIFLVKKFGWRTFELSKNIATTWVNSHEELVREMKDDDKILYLGTGGPVTDKLAGVVIDEHTMEGRKEETCTSTLTAKYLGVGESEGLEDLLSEVLRSDTQASQKNLEMGHFLKTLYGWSTLDESKLKDKIERFSGTAFRALLRYENGDDIIREPTVFTVGESVDNCLPCEGREKQTLRVIAIPAYSQFDNLAKLFVCMTYARRRYHMPKKMKIVFVSDEDSLEELKNRNDVIFIGFNDGRYAVDKSFLSVARSFGADSFDEVQSIRKDVRRFETSSGVRMFELSNIVSKLNRWSNITPEDIWKRVRWILDASFRQASEFSRVCPEEFEKYGHSVEVSGVKVGAVSSDLRSMASWFLTRANGGVLLLMNSKRQTQIITAHSHVAMGKFIAREILQAELEKKDMSNKKRRKMMRKMNDLIESGQDNSLPGASHWYLHLTAGNLYNGTTTKEVKKTGLSMKQLSVALIKGVKAYVDSLSSTD